MKTIYATSSGRPPAAIAVVRISGKCAFAVAQALAGNLPPPRVAGLRALRDHHGTTIDRALILVFPGPASATGEDVVEFHCHGGRAVVAAVETAVAREPETRLAEPGEFTRRALMNGRIDLAQAEGLADLIAAETEAQRIAAMDASEGRVSRAANGWSKRLAALSAAVEASLDWSDEGDVGDDGSEEAIKSEARVLAADIDAALAAPPIERMGDGIRVVIAGPPNAGKSTLFNALVERQAAIVSPVAGTTRDVIEASIVRNGVVYSVIDTAGIHDNTSDPIEREGMARAEAARARADLVLWLCDSEPADSRAIWVHAKADLPDRCHRLDATQIAIVANDEAKTDTLWLEIERRAIVLLPTSGTLPLLARHRTLCLAARDALVNDSPDPLILAENLRTAHRSLAEITGANAAEAMLDALFSRFCVGK